MIKYTKRPVGGTNVMYCARGSVERRLPFGRDALAGLAFESDACEGRRSFLRPSAFFSEILRRGGLNCFL